VSLVKGRASKTYRPQLLLLLLLRVCSVYGRPLVREFINNAGAFADTRFDIRRAAFNYTEDYRCRRRPPAGPFGLYKYACRHYNIIIHHTRGVRQTANSAAGMTSHDLHSRVHVGSNNPTRGLQKTSHGLFDIITVTCTVYVYCIRTDLPTDISGDIVVASVRRLLCEPTRWKEDVHRISKI
jgi:hypothetical protein